MYFAVGADRREPRVLEDFAVDGDGVALFEMGRQRWVALAERTQKLPNVARLELDLRVAAGELLERAAENYARQDVTPLCPLTYPLPQGERGLSVRVGSLS